MGMKDISVKIEANGVEHAQKAVEEVSKALKKLNDSIGNITFEFKNG